MTKYFNEAKSSMESSASKRSYEDRVRSLQQRYRNAGGSGALAGGGSPSRGKSASQSPGTQGSYGRLRKMLQEDLEADREKHCDSILGRLADARKDNAKMEKRVEMMDAMKRESESAERVAKSRAADMDQMVQQCRREIAMLTEENDKLRTAVEKGQSLNDNTELKKDEAEREANRAREKANDFERRLSEVHATSLEYQARVEELLAERTNEQKRIDHEKMLRTEVEMRVKELVKDLEQSERDRLQLKTEYVEMGEKFQELMQYEDREHDQAVNALGGKVQALQEKLQLYKRRLQEAQKDKQQMIEHKNKELSAMKQEVCDYQARYDAREREITTNLQLANMKAIGDVMPTSTHQQIVSELKTGHHQSWSENSKSIEAKHAHEIAEQRRQFETTLNEIKNGVKILEAEKDTLMTDRNALSASCEQAKARLEEAQARRDELGRSLNLANEHLTKVRSMYEEEASRRQEVEAKHHYMLEEDRKREVGAERAIAALTAENNRLLDLTKEIESHRNLVNETKDELQKRTELHTQVMHAHEMAQRDLELYKKQCNDHESAHNRTMEKLEKVSKLKDVKHVVADKTAKLHSELTQLRADFQMEVKTRRNPRVGRSRARPQRATEYILRARLPLALRVCVSQGHRARAQNHSDLHQSHPMQTNHLHANRNSQRSFAPLLPPITQRHMQDYMKEKVSELHRRGVHKETKLADLHLNFSRQETKVAELCKVDDENSQLRDCLTQLVKEVARCAQVREDLVDQVLSANKPGISSDHFSLAFNNFLNAVDTHIDQKHQAVVNVHREDFTKSMDQMQTELNEHKTQREILEQHVDAMPLAQEMIYREAEKPLKEALRTLKADFEDLQMQYNIDMQRKDREIETELEKRIMEYEATTEAHVAAAKDALARQNEKVARLEGYQNDEVVRAKALSDKYEMSRAEMHQKMTNLLAEIERLGKENTHVVSERNMHANEQRRLEETVDNLKRKLEEMKDVQKKSFEKWNQQQRILTEEKEKEIDEHRKEKDQQLDKMAKIMKKTIERMPSEIQTNALANSPPNSRFMSPTGKMLSTTPKKSILKNMNQSLAQERIPIDLAVPETSQSGMSMMSSEMSKSDV